LAKAYFESFINMVGNKEITNVTYGDCEKHQQHCIDMGLRPATANSRKATVSRVFALAVKRGQLDKNPFTGLRKMKVPKNKIRVFSGEEVSRMFEACVSKMWQARLLLAKTVGLRRGEILNLTIDEGRYAQRCTASVS
jgi:site-specific recombinase XerD